MIQSVTYYWTKLLGACASS